MSRIILTFEFALISLFISGCQLLPSNEGDASHLVVWTSRAPQTVPTHEFALDDSRNMVGGLATVETGDDDTLSDLARHYGLGFNDITIANPNLEPWILPERTPVVLPLRFILPDAPHQGLVLNLASMRLFFYPGTTANAVLTYPVGIGRQGWSTPLGDTKVNAKQVNPDWVVPESIKREHMQQGDPLPSVIHAGADNPLGNYAMRLGFGSILIHGTNKPYGIGMRVSHGCIQLYPEDIETLFNKVNVGAPVKIVHQPYLAAWEGDTLFVEAHAPLENWAKKNKLLKTEIKQKIKTLAAEKHAEIDWPKVDRILDRADGIPTPVLMHSEEEADMIDHAERLQHPDRLYQKPAVAEIKDSDWSIRSAHLPSAEFAKKLAAMLNHLDPQIPARITTVNGEYQVIAGPFRNAKETQAGVKRIEKTFEMDVKAVAPKS
ncbi:MAG: L,D-transpeptidase family protein [Methylomonas sp.]|jgi:L,D-transpeptidase ErfK/SrfK